jgi:acyl-CoA thioesterase
MAGFSLFVDVTRSEFAKIAKNAARWGYHCFLGPFAMLFMQH